MAKIDGVDKEMAAYETRPLMDIKIQEALIIIAVYAAQLDYQNCEADVKRIYCTQNTGLSLFKAAFGIKGRHNHSNKT
jgi:hypothetical protein